MKHVEGAGRASCDPVQTEHPVTLSRHTWIPGNQRTPSGIPAPGKQQFCPTKVISQTCKYHKHRSGSGNKNFPLKNSRNKCIHGTNTIHSELNVSSHAEKPTENETLKYLK